MSTLSLIRSPPSSSSDGHHPSLLGLLTNRNRTQTTSSSSSSSSKLSVKSVSTSHLHLLRPNLSCTLSTPQDHHLPSFHSFLRRDSEGSDESDRTNKSQPSPVDSSDSGVSEEVLTTLDPPQSFRDQPEETPKKSIFKKTHIRNKSSTQAHLQNIINNNQPTTKHRTMSISPSLNSVHSNSTNSSDDSAARDKSLIELGEDIILLTNYVKSFRESLSKIKGIFLHPDALRHPESLKVQAHEKLGEVLRILRLILEKFPAIRSTELLMAAGNMIQRVKEHRYDSGPSQDLTEFFDGIDQLATAFSQRVSAYLMGDIDSSISPPSSKRLGSRENLVDGGDTGLTPTECDSRFLKIPEGIDLALHRAKVWSKYAKDVMTYIEKRSQLEAEHASRLAKLAQTTKPLLKEESFLPFQSIYGQALDHDIENSHATLSSSNLLGEKILPPLNLRRSEHERMRKQIKSDWNRELKRMHESVNNLRKAKSLYMSRQAECERAKAVVSSCTDPSQMDKKKRLEDEAAVRAMEAESNYRSCVAEANERSQLLEQVKKELLIQIRELIYACDQTMKAVTVGYFQLQHSISAAPPVHFQTLCESSRIYEPGSSLNDFVKRLPTPTTTPTSSAPIYKFHSFFDQVKQGQSKGPTSDTESLESGEEKPFKELEPSSLLMTAGSRGTGSGAASSGDELETDMESVSYGLKKSSTEPVQGRKEMTGRSPSSVIGSAKMSKAALTHAFKKLKTPSRCKECESYLYFQGLECQECGLSLHKKCLQNLNITCPHKRMPKKMTTFGASLTSQAPTNEDMIPAIVSKCISEIDSRGRKIKGLYRVSGVKSKVEKLCQSFETGADLVDLSDVHPNVIANVLKLYFRQLPEPLMTHRLYPEFIRVAKEFPASSRGDDVSEMDADKSLNSSNASLLTSVELQEIHQLVNVVSKLPKVHYLTLSFLMHHLKRVSDKSAENNMPSSNLGIVFGPTLLRTSEGGSSLSSLVDTVHQTRVVDLLITYAHQVFGSPLKVDLHGKILGFADPKDLDDSDGGDDEDNDPLDVDHDQENVSPVDGQFPLSPPPVSTNVIPHRLVRSATNRNFVNPSTTSPEDEDDDIKRHPTSLPVTTSIDRYSSSVVITLAGQKVFTSGPTSMSPTSMTSSSSSPSTPMKSASFSTVPFGHDHQSQHRSSISEMRKQFFIQPTTGVNYRERLAQGIDDPKCPVVIRKDSDSDDSLLSNAATHAKLKRAATDHHHSRHPTDMKPDQLLSIVPSSSTGATSSSSEDNPSPDSSLLTRSASDHNPFSPNPERMGRPKFV